MPSEAPTPAKDRDLTLVVLALITTVFTMGLLIFNIVFLAQQAKEASATFHAVCAYRTELVLQVQSSEQYLRLHPDGAPSLGITSGQIQQTIDRQQDVVTSLTDLNCPTK